jgi:hypothetical protein
MIKIALITPDRGDRPEFLDHCRWQMQRQTIKGAKHFIIGEPGIDGVVDIVPRVKKGIKLASEEGFDHCFIIENDDYYPDNYLEKMLYHFRDETGLLGICETIYYSLQLQGWMLFSHPGRASLFCTAFRISSLQNYAWPDDQLLYFDRHLWMHKCKKSLIALGHPPIGIKHGNGFCPGNYHNGIVNGKPARNMKVDTSMQWLRKRTRPESFKFYSDYSNKLIKSE